MVLVQKLHLFRSFLFKQYRPEKCVLRYSTTKKPFSRQYKKSSTSRKTKIFPKQLTNGFGPKMVIFPWFFLNICQGNVFYDILKRKNAFLGYKHKTTKKSKNWDFSKGVNPCFACKNGLFSIFFLSNIGQENVCYDILEQKYDFLGYKHKEFKKSKN